MPHFAHVRGLVLDLDDTLFPERMFVRSGFGAVADAHADVFGSADEAFDLLWSIFETGNRARVFNAALAARGKNSDQSIIDAMIKTYRSHRPTLMLHDDAERLLARCAGRLKLGILSDGPLNMQQRKIDALNLATRVHAIELTDACGRAFWKPHPGCFEQIAARLGCGPNALAYVADNPEKDFIAPNALGWTTIQIQRADGVYRDRLAPPGGAPQHIIDSLDALSF